MFVVTSRLRVLGRAEYMQNLNLHVYLINDWNLVYLTCVLQVQYQVSTAYSKLT